MSRMYTRATARLRRARLSFFFRSDRPLAPPSLRFPPRRKEIDMVEKTQPITKDGLQKIEEELRYLETVRRTEVADKIRQAKELLSTPNDAEYEDAKNEQAMVEGRIQQLQSLIQNAELIDEDGAHKSKIVMLGTTVKVK